MWNWCAATGLAFAVWTASCGGAAAAPAMPSTLSEPARQGIVEALQRGDACSGARVQGLDDRALRAAALAHSRRVLGMRVRPGAADPLWAMAPRARDVEAEFDRHLTAGDVGAWLQGLAPGQAQYHALATWRCRYAAMVDAGGWATLPPGPSLRAGARGPGVKALRIRLAAEGYAIPPTKEDDLFDAALADVLKRFQVRHDLAPDGVLGGGTRNALDVTAGRRLSQIEANLERWRWAPPAPADRIEVDAAGDEAVLYIAGEARLRMRVITGDPKHRTPVFVSRVDAVVFNPPWNVPASIAKAELWPKEAAHPGYLATNQIRLVDGRLQQAAGPKNSLGLVKFDLPDPFGIYLHDTPARAAFARPDRHLSHGCIRLEAPRELATLLMGPQGWSRQRIDAAIATGATQRWPLARPMPVFVFYWTAGVDEAGDLILRPDPYRWDDKLTQALVATKTP